MQNDVFKKTHLAYTVYRVQLTAWDKMPFIFTSDKEIMFAFVGLSVRMTQRVVVEF